MSRNYMNSEAFRDQVSRDLRSDAEFERRQRENRLTAAAPDLLLALTSLLATGACLAVTHNSDAGLAEAVDRARAAVRKAEGR